MRTVITAVIAGAGAGGVTAMAVIELTRRRAARRMLLFHFGVHCPGHIPGSSASVSLDCPAAR